MRCLRISITFIKKISIHLKYDKTSTFYSNLFFKHKNQIIMLKPLLKFSLLFAIVTLALLTSCNKEETGLSEIENVDDITNEDEDLQETQIFTAVALLELQDSSSTGPYGCFELVFPITVQFADSSTVEVIDYDELQTTIQAWKDANPDATERPTFVYPIEVLSEDGELISIADRQELKALKRSCKKDKKGKKGCKEPCFDIVYPLTVSFPDGTTAAAADRSELKTLIRDFKDANPDATEKPEIVFPIEVIITSDGSIVTVNDKDELKALKQSCSDDDDD